MNSLCVDGLRCLGDRTLWRQLAFEAIGKPLYCTWYSSMSSSPPRPFLSSSSCFGSVQTSCRGIAKLAQQQHAWGWWKSWGIVASNSFFFSSCDIYHRGGCGHRLPSMTVVVDSLHVSEEKEKPWPSVTCNPKGLRREGPMPSMLAPRLRGGCESSLREDGPRLFHSKFREAFFNKFQDSKSLGWKEALTNSRNHSENCTKRISHCLGRECNSVREYPKIPRVATWEWSFHFESFFFVGQASQLNSDDWVHIKGSRDNTQV